MVLPICIYRVWSGIHNLQYSIVNIYVWLMSCSRCLGLAQLPGLPFWCQMHSWDVPDCLLFYGWLWIVHPGKGSLKKIGCSHVKSVYPCAWIIQFLHFCYYCHYLKGNVHVQKTHINSVPHCPRCTVIFFSGHM